MDDRWSTRSEISFLANVGKFKTRGRVQTPAEFLKWREQCLRGYLAAAPYRTHWGSISKGQAEGAASDFLVACLSTERPKEPTVTQDPVR